MSVVQMLSNKSPISQTNQNLSDRKKPCELINRTLQAMAKLARLILN